MFVWVKCEKMFVPSKFHQSWIISQAILKNLAAFVFPAPTAPSPLKVRLLLQNSAHTVLSKINFPAFCFDIFHLLLIFQFFHHKFTVIVWSVLKYTYCCAIHLMKDKTPLAAQFTLICSVLFFSYSVWFHSVLLFTFVARYRHYMPRPSSPSHN